MFQALVLHHAVPEHRADFVAFMHRVMDAVRDAPGLLEFTAWDAQAGPLVAISRWQSAEAFEQALPTILAFASERRPEWSDRDDDLFLGVPA